MRSQRTSGSVTLPYICEAVEENVSHLIYLYRGRKSILAVWILYIKPPVFLSHLIWCALGYVCDPEET